MNNLRKILIAVFLSIVAISCNTNGKSAKNAQNIDSIAKSFWSKYLPLDPPFATRIGDNRFNDKMNINVDSQFIDTKTKLLEKYQKQVALFDTLNLSDKDRLNYDLLTYFIDIELEGMSLGMQQGTIHALMPINQFNGMHIEFGLLGSGAGAQPFNTVKDYENFIERMKIYRNWADAAIANMRKGMKAGLVLPKACAERIVSQLQPMANKKLEENLYYSPLKKIPETFTKEEKEKITGEYSKAIADYMISANELLIKFIQDEYLPACRTTSGWCALPNGNKMYRYMVKFWTTSNTPPEQIFETSKREVDRIKGEIEKVKNEVAFKGSMEEFFEFARKDKQFTPFQTDAEVIKAYMTIYEKIKSNIPKLFDLVPKTAFEVRQTEKFREKTASAEYKPGTADGKRPGVFYAPIINAKEYNNTRMEDLFLHEAITGHHFQISIQQETMDMPDFHRYWWIGSFGEGWALYSENLGKDLGVYQDPYQYLGKLMAEMHRAIRLVVDVGIHLKGWTREEAIKYMLENESTSEQNAVMEVERYMAWPAQALSYKMGELKILELKNKAQSALKEKFDIREFHKQVLKDGVLPLSIFEKKMNQWMNQR